MIPAHNFYGPKLKCYGLNFLFAKINLRNDTWTNRSATHGPFRARHVDKLQRDMWTIQSSRRGQTAARYVDHSELDTWTNRSATRGQT
jgi:hypothetical protein